MKIDKHNPRATSLLLAGLIAGAAFTAQAQPAGAANPPQTIAAPTSQAQGAPRADRAERRVQRMQVRRAQRLAALKVMLKLTPQQEGAWDAFSSAAQPSAEALQRRVSMRTDLRTLPTPERIDRMRELRHVRDAAMDQRFDAAKTFYAQLSAEQQKTFDENAMRDGRMGQHGRHHGRRGDMQEHGSHHAGGHHSDEGRGAQREGS